ncbi:Carbon-nitrogen hydrolase [Rhizobium sp. RU33A]|uniref:conjugal transfer protein TraB n=1 Tax=Rhizobium sp. RU33A TaxID=1907413 RepID=UPI000955B150|nr:conjugal transfer protein TraB [Rhizobium sp. RU33A]SIQ89337.1 Carbon-nitrogen hydrolase [Rhizobium sp. RU33A]
MRHESWNSVSHAFGLSSLSGAIAVFAWTGDATSLPLALVFPLIWSRAKTRLAAALISASYILVASRDLPLSVAEFFKADILLGLGVWIAAAFSFVLVHILLWSEAADWRRALRYALIMALTGFPPLGITGFAHPLTAAGIVFPGWGWFGLCATVILACCLVTRHWWMAALALGVLWLWSSAPDFSSKIEMVSPNASPENLSPASPEAKPLALLAAGPTAERIAWPRAWKAVELRMGKSLGRDPSLRHQRELMTKVLEAAGRDESLILLPESALGLWTSPRERFWRKSLEARAITVIAGATVINADGYDNVILALDKYGSRVIYRQRMPVPVSMWRPWHAWTGQSGGTRARFFDNPVAEFDGMRVAPLICYEQLLLWPILHSMAYDPDLLVVIGNGWWTAGAKIVAVQRASATAWTRLFSLPLVMAFNL